MTFKSANQLLEIPSTDAEDARRRRLLNILLAGVASLSFIMLIAAVTLSLIGRDTQEDYIRLGLNAGMIFLGVGVAYLVNRYWSGEMASLIFLSIITVVIALSDSPRQVVEGRSLFLFTVPILMASVILRAWASFIMAGITSIVITILAMTNLEDYAQGSLPLPTFIGFFGFALISWLSAHSLENALRDLRSLNAELEQRVEERTRELATMNQRLQAYTQELEESNAELDAFAHTVAHDLKGPMSIISGFSELLIERSHRWSREKIQDTSRRIKRTSEKMTNIIDELLLLASVRKQKDIEIGPLSMDRIMAEVRERLDEMIAEYRAEIIEPASWPVAAGYAPWIEEVWANYLSNAIKYGGEPPRVELGATKITGDGEPPMIRFWIRDNGVGLSEEEQAQLFTQFTRLHLNQARGHGLGLSIVQRIVTRLNGDVGVESEPGQGVAFYFTLPLADDHHALQSD